jgi:hypothetical protein
MFHISLQSSQGLFVEETSEEGNSVPASQRLDYLLVWVSSFSDGTSIRKLSCARQHGQLARETAALL